MIEREQGLFEKSVVPKLMQLPWFTEKRERFTCPCCGFKTLKDERNWDICGICFWEDDPSQFENPDLKGGAHNVSLREAQQHYLEFGACDEQSLDSVRKPNADDEKDANWRPSN